MEKIVNDETILHEIRELIENKFDRLEKYIHAELGKLETKIDSLSSQHDRTKDVVIKHEQMLVTMSDTDKFQQATLETLKENCTKFQTRIDTMEIEKNKAAKWVQWAIPFVWAIAAFVIARMV